MSGQKQAIRVEYVDGEIVFRHTNGAILHKIDCYEEEPGIPHLDSVSPTSGLASTVITLAGTNLGEITTPPITAVVCSRIPYGQSTMVSSPFVNQTDTQIVVDLTSASLYPSQWSVGLIDDNYSLIEAAGTVQFDVLGTDLRPNTVTESASTNQFILTDMAGDFVDGQHVTVGGLDSDSVEFSTNVSLLFYGPAGLTASGSPYTVSVWDSPAKNTELHTYPGMLIVIP